MEFDKCWSIESFISGHNLVSQANLILWDLLPFNINIGWVGYKKRVTSIWVKKIIEK